MRVNCRSKILIVWTHTIAMCFCQTSDRPLRRSHVMWCTKFPFYCSGANNYDHLEFFPLDYCTRLKCRRSFKNLVTDIIAIFQNEI